MKDFPILLFDSSVLEVIIEERMIDFHTHIFSPAVREGREKFFARNRIFHSIYADPKAKMVGLEELIEVMDREGVERAVVCGFPWEDLEVCQRENDYLLEAMVRYPRRVLPFVTFPWGKEGLEELERALGAGARGVGEIAPGTYEERLIPLEEMKEAFSMAQEAGVPVLIHYNEPLGHDYPGKGKVGLREIEVLIRTFQGVDIVLAHLGGGFFFYELMPEIKEICSRVWYDTAAAPFLYDRKIYRIAFQVVGERLLFGSDYPLLSPSRYLRDMEGLGEGEKEALLEANAKKLLRLTD